jgi:hypothetical protein
VQLQELLGTRLEHKTESEMPRMKQKQRKRVSKLASKLMLRPKVTQMHHWLCVLLYFGSLTDFREDKLSFSQVARLTGLSK